MSSEFTKPIIPLRSELATRIPLIDIPKTPKEVVKEARWEVFRYGETPISGVSVQWGCPVDNEELSFFLNTRGHNTRPEQFDPTGFILRSINYASITMDEALETERVIGAQSIIKAAEARKIDPAQIQMLIVSNTFPGKKDAPNNHYAEQIREMAGLSPDIPVLNLSLACNGASESYRYIGEYQEELQNKFVAIVSAEGLTKMAERTQGFPVDPIDASVFTNRAVTSIVQVAKDFLIKPVDFNKNEDNLQQLPPGFMLLLDPGTIKGPATYNYKKGSIKGLMVTPTEIRQKLNGAETAVYAHMDARLTSEWTVGVVAPEFIKILKTAELRPNRDGKIVVVLHHPSKGVFDGLLKRAVRAGFTNLQAEWVVNDGNSSASTFPIALLRTAQLGKLTKEGDNLCVGFGVGGSLSAFTITLN